MSEWGNINPRDLDNYITGHYGEDQFEEEPMESWQKVWRDGFAPLLSTDQLTKLRTALETDDERLVQGSTTSPPPTFATQDWTCEAACAISFCGWDEGDSVGIVEDRFAGACHECDRVLGEPGACRYFITWFDDTPRDRMRRELMAEIDLVLHERRAA